MPLSELPTRLVDAFVDVIAPVAARRASSARLVAVEEGDGFALHRVARGRVSALGRTGALDPGAARQLKALARGPVELRLAAGRVIERSVRVPAAGAQYLEAILAHRVDRLTPWRADQVMFGYAADGTPDAEGQIDVAFAATSKAIAGEATERLAAHGIVATAIGPAAGPLDTPLSVDLYLGRRNPARRRLRRAVVMAGVVGLALLVPLAGGSFALLAREHAAATEVQARVLAVRRTLVARSGAGSAGERAAVLLAAKTRDRSAVVLIDRIAAALPDGTYLSALEIGPDAVRLTGRSNAAPRLIARLQDDAGLADVRFAAPVTRDAQGEDGFDIVAARALSEATPAAKAVR